MMGIKTDKTVGSLRDTEHESCEEISATKRRNYAQIDETSNMDSGWAWMILAGCFMSQMLNPGMFWSFGILLLAWEEQLSDSVTKLQWILSLLLTMAHISGMLGSFLCKIYSIRWVALIGTALATCSFALASLSKTLWHLYITFAMAGIGMGLLMESTYVILVYYFKKRLARANGLANAAVGIALFIIPPLTQHLVDVYGWNGALLFITGLFANNGIAVALYRPSPTELATKSKAKYNSANTTELSTDAKTKQVSNYSISFFAHVNILKNMKILSILISLFWCSIGYLMLTTFSPARAALAGSTPQQAAFLVSIMGIASFFTRLTHGYILDYNIMSATSLTIISLIICAFCSILNPLNDQFEYLATLAALFGASGGVINSIQPLLLNQYAGRDNIMEAIGLSLLVVGVGILLGSYCTGVLVDLTHSYTLPFYLAGISFFISAFFIFVIPMSELLKRCMKVKSSHRSEGNREDVVAIKRQI